MLDLLIKNIDIADGSGKPIYRGDVGIKNGKIEYLKKIPQCADSKQSCPSLLSAVSKQEPRSEQSGDFEPAAHIIEGKEDELLTPGFIDTHTHGDLQSVLDPFVRTQLLQGVTYSICGNCGISAAPVSSKNFSMLKDYCRPVLPFDNLDEEWRTWTTFGKYLESVKKRNPVFQNGALVGQGTLRIAVMGMKNRSPSDSELEQMKKLLDDAMTAGALGLSSGLIYIPGVYSGADEMIELCKIVARHNGFYSTHMRSESNNIVEAVKEAIYVAEQSKCKLIISHLKVSGLQNEKYTEEILQLILDARARGVQVICDQYQSNKGSTTLAQLINPVFQSEGSQALVRKLSHAESRQKIIDSLKNDVSYENYLRSLGPEQIIIVSDENNPEFNGLTLKEISDKIELSPEETVCDILLKNKGNALMAVTMCDQSVVDRIFKFPYAAVGSDGIGAGSGKKTHPRAYGNFVHLFQDYVRERKLLPWEEAVRKCTSLPADFIGLTGKGHIEKGYDADFVILNKKNIGTEASFAKPDLPPKGIEHVFIGGKEVVRHGNLVFSE